MKVAIFGGSFNPVHNEHINIVKAAQKSLNLDKIIIMPSFITPNKTFSLFAPPEKRLEMCKSAFSEIEQAEVSDWEIKRGGVSYSYETCEKFKADYPDAERYFIVGADMLENFPKWKYPKRILSCVKLAACARENENFFAKAAENFKSLYGEYPVNFNYVGAGVSSTKVRALAALNCNLSPYIPQSIENYIKLNGLYKLDISAEKVKSFLTEKRWLHTVGVAVAAAENCAAAGVSETDAITCACLHDAAKYMRSGEGLLKNFTPPENVPEPVVHQYAGAYLAEHYFEIKDKNIINAVKYHCSARPDTSPLEKLIYVCDMVEEGRDYAGVDRLRDALKVSLNYAFEQCLIHSINFLKQSGTKRYYLTQQALEFIQGKK